jgi:hypothetical protein
MKYLMWVLSISTIFLLFLGHFQYQKKMHYQTAAAHNAEWENKNWLAIGDSITFANKYQPHVQRGLGLKSVQTDAIPGQPVKPMADHITAETLKNIDLITVFGGTNDYGSSKQLGTINDAKNEDTFYGNLKHVIEKINANKREEAKVVFFTPLKRGVFKNQPVYPGPNKSGHKLEDYVEAEKQVCKLYSIPVIDLFSKSGLKVNNLSKYTTDQLHPNDEGYQKIANVMIKELKKTAVPE